MYALLYRWYDELIGLMIKKLSIFPNWHVSNIYDKKINVATYSLSEDDFVSYDEVCASSHFVI